jgi:iron complex outermembrane receptor protein
LTDAKITRSNNGDEGKAPAGVPRHNIALWGTYRFSQEAWRGFKMGAGLRRIIGTSGYVLGSTPTPAELPAYNVVDAMISYEKGPWTYTLNINNLFDETYVQSCYYATTTCFYGDGRNAIARATYRW